MSTDILIVDDEADIRNLISGILEDDGYSTRQAANSQMALKEIKAQAPAVILLDIWLDGNQTDGLKLLEIIKKVRPKSQVIMISGHGTIQTAVRAIKLGAFDFIEKPFESDRLLFLIKRSLENSRLKNEVMQLKAKTNISEDLIGNCNAILNIKRTIERVGPTGSRVLITGPAGAGKEVVARLIHKHSKRKDAPFIVISCASLDPDKFTKILFGNSKFSNNEGLFYHADGGTILLDEVADMPIETQRRVIRLLQEQKLDRINANGSVDVDVRILATSNKDLEKEITLGKFREELFYRLSVVPIKMPSLQDRREDIPDLVKYFMETRSKNENLPTRLVAEDALASLQNHSWPGNARQLRNVIEWLLIMAPGGQNTPIRADMLPADLAIDTPRISTLNRSNEIFTLPLREAREMFEREYLVSQVRKYGGNISRTAEFIGMERSALHRKLKSLGITRDLKINDDSILEFK
tara:strand:+ start:168 stop:1568 length:1401 start_codon:yes stop_codon:yes gene_type:complete